MPPLPRPRRPHGEPDRGLGCRHYPAPSQPDEQPAPAAAIPRLLLSEAELAALQERLGVNYLARIAGTQDRTMKLSQRSTICCLAHGFLLKPDACRSCAFLAGELPPDPDPTPNRTPAPERPCIRRH